jgi:hypothetical protein
VCKVVGSDGIECGKCVEGRGECGECVDCVEGEQCGAEVVRVRGWL